MSNKTSQERNILNDWGRNISAKKKKKARKSELIKSKQFYYFY